MSNQKPCKYGLKLYSHNISSDDLKKDIEKAYREKMFDFIELYIVPGTYENYHTPWANLDIPYVIHAPSFKHGFNLSKESCLIDNLKMFKEAQQFANELVATNIIVHPGVAGSMREVIKQINQFNDVRILIENMPFIGINGKRCVGGSFEEIKAILNSSKVGFCLDIGHAIKHAFSNDLNYYEYLETLMSLNPKIFHLSDGNVENCTDEHQRFGEGNFPIAKIMDMIRTAMPSPMITLETPKKNLQSVNEFIMDLEYLKRAEASRE